MTFVEFVRKIREVVDRGWTQGTIARDANGRGVPATDPKAVCWCLAGAQVRAWDEIGRPVQDEVLLLQDFFDIDYVLWNDKPGRTKEEVLAALDGVIAKLTCSEAR